MNLTSFEGYIPCSTLSEAKRLSDILGTTDILKKWDIFKKDTLFCFHTVENHPEYYITSLTLFKRGNKHEPLTNLEDFERAFSPLKEENLEMITER